MAWRLTIWGQGIAAIAIALAVSNAWSQERPAGTRDEPPPAVTEPTRTPQSVGPPLASYPVELFGLLGPQRGGVTLTPFLSISEEYDDNIFLNNQDREWDLITNFTPGVTLAINARSLTLIAGYSTTGEVYARGERPSTMFQRHNFLASGIYTATPQLTLTVSELFALDYDTVRVSGFATGRQDGWINTFTPGLTWQATPSTSLSLSASYSVERYEGSGESNDSDTYGFTGYISHGFTPRLTGNLGYIFTYLASQEQDDSQTHTPFLGFSYRLTPTLLASIDAGPAITLIGGDTFVTPAGIARIVQELSFGSVSLQYTQNVRVAGGFGGTNDVKTVSGTLALTSLLRGLTFLLTPAYSIARSVSDQEAEQVDVNAFTLTVGAAYSLGRFAALFGSYTFFRQRTGESSSLSSDVDQNRIRFGLQVGYSFNF